MVKSITIKMIKEFTRLIRPLFGIAGVCRYTVTCSAFARYAVTHYPLPTAIWKIIKRIASCNLFITFK